MWTIKHLPLGWQLDSFEDWRHNVFIIWLWHMLVHYLQHALQMTEQRLEINKVFKWRKVINCSSYGIISHSDLVDSTVSTIVYIFVIHTCKCPWDCYTIYELPYSGSLAWKEKTYELQVYGLVCQQNNKSWEELDMRHCVALRFSKDLRLVDSATVNDWCSVNDWYLTRD